MKEKIKRWASTGTHFVNPYFFWANVSNKPNFFQIVCYEAGWNVRNLIFYFLIIFFFFFFSSADEFFSWKLNFFFLFTIYHCSRCGPGSINIRLSDAWIVIFFFLYIWLFVKSNGMRYADFLSNFVYPHVLMTWSVFRSYEKFTCFLYPTANMFDRKHIASFYFTEFDFGTPFFLVWCTSWSDEKIIHWAALFIVFLPFLYWSNFEELPFCG